jgi:hypothetical protein
VRQYPQVSLDAEEIPGRKYRTVTHHPHWCASNVGDGTVDEARCDCGGYTTKHLEPKEGEDGNAHQKRT